MIFYQTLMILDTFESDMGGTFKVLQSNNVNEY